MQSLLSEDIQYIKGILTRQQGKKLHITDLSQEADMNKEFLYTFLYNNQKLIEGK